MVEGGPIDVLTGDWLAELTMLILARQQEKDATRGFANPFLTQVEEVLGTCLDQGVRIVSNAGGTNPRGCADAIAAMAERLGLAPRIAYVEGDDLLPRIPELLESGLTLENIDTGESFAAAGFTPVTANAYLGGFGVAEALHRGAEVVITGRVTDAAVVLGPAAWWHDWARTDWDRLAGAIAAGHIIECGTQGTGGNYAFFEEVPRLDRPGFPLAEIAEDGSSVITKHDGTGGLVSVGTVTAQLLYEIQGVTYLNPDATLDLSSIALEQIGPDRVLVSGARGGPAPADTKLALNYAGGWRNSMTIGLTGLDIDAKADLVQRTLWSLVPGGKAAFDSVDVHLSAADPDHATSNEDAVALLRITVIDPDRAKVGRAFSNTIIEMLLASVPGFFATTPPGDATSFGVYWPALVPSDIPSHTVVFEGERVQIAAVVDTTEPAPHAVDPDTGGQASAWPDDGAAGPTVRTPLGRVFGARSGDKGGNGNVGVWARDDAAYAWLRQNLTVDLVRELMPDLADLEIRAYDLPNLRARNFVIVGLLGDGVAASTRLDPQAKGLGEYLRSRQVDLPVDLVAR
jgi:hypothetical protein